MFYNLIIINNLKKETTKESIKKYEKFNNFPPLLVQDLSKKYFRNKNFALQNLNFEVKSGEFHGFIGSNGAGKTTTIKSIIGAYAKFKGKIKIFNYNQASIEGKKRIGYIPEVANFPSELNAYQYLKSMAYLSGISKKQSAKFANEKLNEIGLEKFKKRNPNSFSSGQKKKLLLAQSLINNPDLIIMDEPSANLDPNARKDFFNNLKRLQQKGTAIFISSHILVELEQYIDAVTIIDDGKVLFSGKVSDAIQVNKLKYIFLLKNNNYEKHFIDLIKNNNFIIEKNEKKELLVTIKKETDIFKLLGIIVNNKIELIYVKKHIKSLQNIYDDFVNKNKGVI